MLEIIRNGRGEIESVTPVQNDMKVCKRCGRLKMMTAFRRHVSAKDGRTNICQECITRRVKIAAGTERRVVPESPTIRAEVLLPALQLCISELNAGERATLARLISAYDRT